MGTAASHPLDQPLVAEESVDHAANVEAEPNDVQTQESSPPIYNQYMKYLATVLSDDPLGTPMLPKYDGPFDSQTDVVSHSLDGLLRRLRDAEEENKRLRANGASELSRNTAIPNQTFGTSEALTEPWLVVAPSAINEGGRDAAEDLKTLKAQMKEITRVCSSLASGDFTSSVSIEVQDPVMSDLKDSVNRMVDTARAVTSEVVKVCSDISEKGKLGISANIAGVKGSWLDLQIGVNQLADGATNTVRSVITTIKAIRGGDLTKTIDIQAQGEFLELKNTTNSMVTFLESFLSEMTRIPIEIGVMGVLGGEARVDGARGIWAKAVDSTNKMGRNLTEQLRALLGAVEAVDAGNFTACVVTEAQGEIGQILCSQNALSERLSAFAEEVTRLTFEIGTQGVLGGQMDIKDAEGTWAAMGDGINRMSEVVTLQARTVGQVVYAVLEGDLTKKVELDARGEYWAINETVNSLVEHLRNLADELNGVALEIGLEGRLGRQARDHGAKGSWAHLVVNVNRLAENVTIQMRSFGYVALAVTAGDFTKKIDWDGENEVFWVKEAMNGMIEHLSGVATEIRRISREIGTDGKLGGQILPDGMHGTWADLTTDVNSMSENLTVQLRSLGFVTKAVVTGDLSHLITIEAQGEMEAFIYTVNHMVQDLRSVTSEVIHVATEVDRGHLGSQATAKDTEGVWKDMIRAINRMSDTVTNQVRAVGAVTKAVLDGDLTRKVEAWIEAEAKGEFLEAVYIVNATVDQLREFASQMNRIALCYGKEGRLGLIMGFDKEINGTWLELCDNFNRMAGNITRQLRDIYGVSVAVLTGDLTKKLDWNCQGEILHIMRTQNAMVEHLGLIAGRITSVVGTEAFEHIPDHSYHIPLEGRWAEAIEPVDHVAGTHINQMRAIASLLTAVVRGDLSSQLEFEAEGEMLDLKTIVNTMVRRLNALASEVTAVLVEIGLRGQLGAVANINDAEGAWGKMVTELNRMSVNVTSQVRCLAAVTKSIGGGDLTRKVDIECFGEFDGFAEAVDSLVDCLKTFHDEIRGLMIAIGTEGVLGGVAKVPGLGGSWASLTGDINTMSDKLTNQLRAIYTVTRNIARGDFSVFTDVEAQGETLELLNIVRSTQAQILMLRAEVARVVSEAGEGKGDSSPAIVMGAMGGWQALLDDVNRMADMLKSERWAIVELPDTPADDTPKKEEMKVEVEAEGAEHKNE